MENFHVLVGNFSIHQTMNTSTNIAHFYWSNLKNPVEKCKTTRADGSCCSAGISLSIFTLALRLLNKSPKYHDIYTIPTIELQTA